MTLLAVAVLLTLSGRPASVPPTATVGIGPFRLGMSRDEAQRASPCRLRRASNRDATLSLSCSNFKLLASKMRLSLFFKDDRLTMIGVNASGYSEKRARQELAAVLQTLAAEFGELGSPQLAGGPVTSDAAFSTLKGGLTAASTSTMTVTPAKAVPDAQVSGSFHLSRGSAPRAPSIADNWYGYGAPEPTVGSPFEVVTHTISLSIRADSR